jgi:hypothetical protein
MQYSAKDEIAGFEGNARRNFRKLYRSGIIQKILKYNKRSSQKSPESKKPLEIKIHGCVTDADTLLTSIAAQQWRKRVGTKNKLPEGFNKPQLGAANYAFSRGVDPIELPKYFSLKGGNINIFPDGAEAIAAYAKEELGQLQLPGLENMLEI